MSQKKQIPIISSLDNQWIKLYRRSVKGLNKNDFYFIAEGDKLLKSLLTTFQPVKLLTSERFINELESFSEYQDFIEIVSNHLWSLISRVNSPVKLIGIFYKPINTLEEIKYSKGDFIILDRIQDPGNMGTIIRTAVASGWNNLICLKGCISPFSPKVVRSSAGTLSGIKIFTDFCLNSDYSRLSSLFKEEDFLVFYSSSHVKDEISSSLNSILSSINLQNKRLCLILGNEGQGIDLNFVNILKDTLNSQKLIETKLPMMNIDKVESLNVGIAGALFMYKLKGLL